MIPGPRRAAVGRILRSRSSSAGGLVPVQPASAPPCVLAHLDLARARRTGREIEHLGTTVRCFMEYAALPAGASWRARRWLVGLVGERARGRYELLGRLVRAPATCAVRASSPRRAPRRSMPVFDWRRGRRSRRGRARDHLLARCAGSSTALSSLSRPARRPYGAGAGRTSTRAAALTGVRCSASSEASVGLILGVATGMPALIRFARKRRRVRWART